MPLRKVPSRPLAVVGGGINRPLFLHQTQQYHPVYCCPALRHSNTLADRPTVEHFECHVQLQHGSTGSWTHLLDRQLTVEPI